MSATFVGRRGELDSLLRLVAASVERREPAAALISGEPGSGKSRLLREAVERTEPGRWIRLAGFEPSQPIPLAAVGPLLRRLTAVPGHGGLLDRLAFGGDGAQDPLRIFEAAHRAMATLGHVLVAIDDLQWVDAQSLALVDYLIRAAANPRRPFVVVAASRPSPNAATWRSTLELQLPPERRATIEVGPLGLAEGLALVRSIAGGIGGAEAEVLWTRARGSPFWLEALARGQAGNDPSTVIGERLRMLTADAGALLAALAVAGRPVSAEDLAILLDWSPARIDHATHELVGRGLSVAAGTNLALSHDLIREAVESSLPVATRRRLRRRLIEWLEADVVDDLQALTEALGHRLAIGLPTAGVASRILASPRRRLLGRDNLATLASIIDGLAPGPGQLALDRSLAELAAQLGDQTVALARWTRLSRNAADPRERQHAAVEAARAAYRLGRAAEAHALLDDAGEAAPASHESHARQEALRAEILLWLDHRTRAGAEAAGRALTSAAEMLAAADGPAALTPAQRETYFAALEAAIAGALQEERMDDVQRLTSTRLAVDPAADEAARVTVLIRSAFALRPIGAIREAAAKYREAWTISRRIVLPLATVEAGHGLSRSLRDLGQLAEARSIGLETTALEARLGHHLWSWGNGLAIVHLVELLLGQTDALNAMRADAESEPNPHYRLAIHQQIALWLARRDGPRAAAEVTQELAAARADAALAGCPRCAAEVAVESAEALARIGNLVEAKAELAAWEAREVDDYLMRRLWRDRARAAIGAAEGDPSVTSLLRGLIAEQSDVGLVEDALWSRLSLGRIAASTDRALAVESLTAVAVEAEALGAQAFARLAAQELRVLGVRAWRRGRAAEGVGLLSLSGREREIADHLAAGRSNREIAETLVISPKTVERHVTNILAKLGARNRAEVAARLGTGTGFPR